MWNKQKTVKPHESPSYHTVPSLGFEIKNKTSPCTCANLFPTPIFSLNCPVTNLFPLCLLLSRQFTQSSCLDNLCTLENVLLLCLKNKNDYKAAIYSITEWASSCLYHGYIGLHFLHFLMVFKKKKRFLTNALCRCLLNKWIQLQRLRASCSLFSFWLLCKYLLLCKRSSS